MKSKKMKKKNIKLISAIVLVIIMIIVLILNLTTNGSYNESKDYTLEYIETLEPGIKHDIILKKDGSIEVSSIIKSVVDIEVEPVKKNIKFSEKNQKNLKKFIKSYFKDKKYEVTVNASDIHGQKEQYLLESIVYGCEGCYELETNSYKNRISSKVSSSPSKLVPI